MTETTFLLVDDDEIAVLAVQRALKRLKIESTAIVARNGYDALELLRNTAEAEKSGAPPSS